MSPGLPRRICLRERATLPLVMKPYPQEGRPPTAEGGLGPDTSDSLVVRRIVTRSRGQKDSGRNGGVVYSDSTLGWRLDLDLGAVDVPELCLELNAQCTAIRVLAGSLGLDSGWPLLFVG